MLCLNPDRPDGRKPRRWLSALLCLVLLAPLATSAYTLEQFTFDSEEREREFRELASELRCLVCQNESLAGSNAELAQDLRLEVYQMMQAGQGKQEIIDFLVARYGDFVLYDPPVKPSTYPIWFGPVILLLIGAVLLVRTLKRKNDSQEATLSDDEQRRLATLLKRAPDSTETPK